MITEGISNISKQLVRRGDALSQDSSKINASPSETVENQKQNPAEEFSYSALKVADKVDIFKGEAPKSELTGASEDDAKEIEETDSAIKEMVQELNQKFDRTSLRLRFGTDEESGLDYFQLYDRKNGDVVKQFPPEGMLEMVAHLKDMTGIIFNENV